MRRLMSFLLVGLMVAGAAYTFEMKRRATNAAKDIASLKASIEAKKEDIKLLKAEVTYLARPARLQELTEAHSEKLKLQPIRADQIIQVNELPSRPIDLSPLERDDQLGGFVGKLLEKQIR